MQKTDQHILRCLLAGLIAAAYSPRISAQTFDFTKTYTLNDWKRTPAITVNSEQNDGCTLQAAGADAKLYMYRSLPSGDYVLKVTGSGGMLVEVLEDWKKPYASIRFSGNGERTEAAAFTIRGGRVIYSIKLDSMSGSGKIASFSCERSDAQSGTFTEAQAHAIFGALPRHESIPEIAAPVEAEKPAMSMLASNTGNGIVYKPWNDRGDRLPDWSYCGYEGGGVAIPVVPVAITVSPPENGDAGKVIQNAIDTLARRSPDAGGFRGAVLLKRGVYIIAGKIFVHAGGIVLRGEGNDTSGTVLISTTKASGEDSVFIEIGGSGAAQKTGTGQEITTPYVPVGTRSFDIQDTGGFKAGDNILLLKRVNDTWLEDTGLKGLDGWNTQSYSYNYLRTITGISGSKVTIDVPLVDAVNSIYGGGSIAAYEWNGRISRCGIENMLLVSCYDVNVMRDPKDYQIDFGYLNIEPFAYNSDENHSWVAVQFGAIAGGWARKLRSYHFSYSLVRLSHKASRITVEDSQCLDAVSRLQGGRRYSFCIYGQQNLVQRCYTRNDRHAFVVQYQVPGPNAFVNCLADKTYNFCEPHLCWSTGVLYDNVTVRGPFGILCATWRGFLAKGAHGWATANTLMWNCSSSLVYAMNPPTAQNMVIGFQPLDLPNKKGIISTMETIFKGMDGKKYYYEDKALMGNAYGESLDRYVSPRSLYRQQLRERLGQSALSNIDIPYQD